MERKRNDLGSIDPEPTDYEFATRSHAMPTMTDRLKAICEKNDWDLEEIRMRCPRFTSYVEVLNHHDDKGNLHAHHEAISTDLESDGYGTFWDQIIDDQKADAIEFLQSRHDAKLDYWWSHPDVRKLVDSQLPEWPDDDLASLRSAVEDADRLYGICSANHCDFDDVRERCPVLTSTVHVTYFNEDEGADYFRDRKVVTHLDIDEDKWEDLDLAEKADNLQLLSDRHEAKVEYWEEEPDRRDAVDLDDWPEDDDGGWLRSALSNATPLVARREPTRIDDNTGEVRYTPGRYYLTIHAILPPNVPDVEVQNYLNHVDERCVSTESYWDDFWPEEPGEVEPVARPEGKPAVYRYVYYRDTVQDGHTGTVETPGGDGWWPVGEWACVGEYHPGTRYENLLNAD